MVYWLICWQVCKPTGIWTSLRAGTGWCTLTGELGSKLTGTMTGKLTGELTGESTGELTGELTG